jgi:hypothetical protein
MKIPECYGPEEIALERSGSRDHYPELLARSAAAACQDRPPNPTRQSVTGQSTHRPGVSKYSTRPPTGKFAGHAWPHIRKNNLTVR